MGESVLKKGRLCGFRARCRISERRCHVSEDTEAAGNKHVFNMFNNVLHVKYNSDPCSTVPMLSSCYFVSNIVIRKLTFCFVTVILLSPISLLDEASKHYEHSMYKFCGSDKLKQSVFWLP